MSRRERDLGVPGRDPATAAPGGALAVLEQGHLPALDPLLLESTRDAAEPTTLRGYVERMKEGQKEIYYLTGASRAAIENSPHMEAFTAKGYEVLILPDPIDEVWADQTSEFDGRPLRSIAKGQVDLDAPDEEGGEDTDAKPETEQFDALVTFLTDSLGEHVKQTRLSTRLPTSPACVVGDANDLTPALERMYRAMGHPSRTPSASSKSTPPAGS